MYANNKKIGLIDGMVISYQFRKCIIEREIILEETLSIRELKVKITKW